MWGILIYRIVVMSVYYWSSIFPSKPLNATAEVTESPERILITAESLIIESEIVIPADGIHSSTIIFLHGLGDTGNGWANEIKAIIPSHTKLICPTAPTKPITIYNGLTMPAWYDIRSLTKLDEDIEGILETSMYIQTLIQKEMDAGIPPNRIILGGFSQGAAMSIYTGLTSNVTLAGVVAMSGYIPAIENIVWESASTPPILQCHGELDDIVPFDIGLAIKNVFEQLEYPDFTFKSYENLGHMASDEEMKDIKRFLKRVLR